jgi:threonine aldolase
MPIDLRSDTLTRPTEAMRRAMASADVGDDTFKEDPTVARLEARMAELTGKEAALFVPSGHMGNQLCLRSLSQPGDSVVCHSLAHVVAYETGAMCALSGLQPFTIDSEDGTFTPEQVARRLQRADIHCPKNRIVAMENTHNRGGGTVWPMNLVREVARLAHSRGLSVHMDGARLWNACVATGTRPADWLADVDTVSMCFSKGLGAPVGSAIAGSKDLVERARFFRKQFGGQMRQAGVLAAAALYGIDHHWPRMADDHSNATTLAAMINETELLRCPMPQTNILIAEVKAPGVTAAQVAAALARNDVHVFAISDRHIRAVTHIDVTAEQVRQAGNVFPRLGHELELESMGEARTAVKPAR